MLGHASHFKLKQEAPEEKYAQNQNNCNDDDFNQAHSLVLMRLWVKASLGLRKSLC